MEAKEIVAATAAVVALTQLGKWFGLPDRWGAVLVLGLAAAVVGLWLYSVGGVPRAQALDVFIHWVNVSVAAAGVFGFTRTAAAAVTAARDGRHRPR